MSENKEIMKKIILIIALLFSTFTGYSEIKQNGNNFYVTAENQSDKVTVFTYTDKDGNVYPIYQSKNNSFYIKKISKKTGKEYKQYLPKAVQEKIKKQLGITSNL